MHKVRFVASTLLDAVRKAETAPASAARAHAYLCGFLVLLLVCFCRCAFHIMLGLGPPLPSSSRIPKSRLPTSDFRVQRPRGLANTSLRLLPSPFCAGDFLSILSEIERNYL